MSASEGYWLYACRSPWDQEQGCGPHVEKLITLGKRGDLHSRRLALSYLQTREAVSRLFDTVAPRYGDRAGGYLRIVRTGFQKGDGAEKASIELLGSEHELDEKRQKRAEARAKRREETDRRFADGRDLMMPDWAYPGGTPMALIGIARPRA